MKKLVGLLAVFFFAIALPVSAQQKSQHGGSARPEVGGGHIPAHGPAPSKGAAKPASHPAAAPSGHPTNGAPPPKQVEHRNL